MSLTSSTQQLQCDLQISAAISLKYSNAAATKKWGQVIRSAAPVTQNHLGKPLQNATPLGKPPDMSAGDVSRTAPATRNASLQILPACHRVCTCYKTRTFLTFCFETCFAPQQRALFLHLNFGREVVLESRKMRRMLSHLAGGEIKNRRQFWREADLEVKMVKAHHSRSP